jgi:hypothetical protein
MIDKDAQWRAVLERLLEFLAKQQPGYVHVIIEPHEEKTDETSELLQQC